MFLAANTSWAASTCCPDGSNETTASEASRRRGSNPAGRSVNAKSTCSRRWQLRLSRGCNRASSRLLRL